jgi:mono/diheme cytochrome c family protein
MRRFGWAALVLVLVLGAGIYALNHLDEGGPAVNPVAPTPALIERGAYLALAGNCAGCHTQRGGAPYAGGRAIPTPFGSVFAPNLTPDPSGMGGWTGEHFWRALHNGRGRDGRLLTPAFPYTNYALVNRADADALFAYLQSLPPVAAERRPHELRFPYNTQIALAAWRALYFRPATFVPKPEKSAEWNRGAYLTQGLGHCNACHATRNALGATGGLDDFSGDMLKGLGWYAPSLHDAAEGSVAGWTPAEVSQWLKSGSAVHGTALGPMSEVILGSTQHLDDADLAAMTRYLQSLPQHAPAAKVVDDRPELALREIGKKLYTDHCAACHGAQGEGGRREDGGLAYPALAGNRLVTMANPANLLVIIQRGGFAPATAGNPRPYGMPPFAGVLDDAQQAALASFLRNAWGNEAADVRPVEVLKLKSQRGG